MNKDISEILKGWPYAPGEITARLVNGQDGKPKVQLRLDLGLLQMETEGRPDGARPHGAESLLDFHENRLKAHIKEKGGDEGFCLLPCVCTALREEGLQYYFRYLAMFSLGEFAAVERDTRRNLRLFDFMHRYAAEPADRVSLEIYRPYVLMMMARARALAAAESGRIDEAVGAVEEGLESIREFLRVIGQEKIFEESCEAGILKKLKKDLEQALPLREHAAEDSLGCLKKDLAKAVDREQFEEAAKLRDRIQRLEDSEDAEEEPGRS